ncbi:MAG: hypothetical protein LW847_00360 [Burkholderiales bacterium]|jgi:hypothetical protein|nr:hypothetical protein [Burkholderiales bacterium]
MAQRASPSSPAGAGYDCPSAQPDMPGARPFGVISGTAGETRIAFFKRSALDDFDWRERFGTTDATRLFRFGARCEEGGCQHYDGHRCSLGERVAQGLPPVVDALPPCLIRNRCRWYAEQGGEVCRRCPQVVTMIPQADTPLNAVAAPR